MSAYDDSAEIYEMGGLSPIPVMGKDLPISGATGYKGTVTAEKIMLWLHSDPKVRAKAGRGVALNNVALRHGLTLAVDVDHGYGDKDGVAQLAAFAAKHNLPPLPATWSSTARGDDSPSRQFIYTIPEDVKMKTKPCKSVEVCNWHHRYTVVAPSIHPTNGKQYTWYLPGEAGVPPTWGTATTRYPRRENFTPLPMEWFDVFRGGVANADHSVDTVELTELVDTFPAGDPGGLVQFLMRKWSTEHVGHDEFKNAMINALMLGRAGHEGVSVLVELLINRFSSYVELERPHAADHEVSSLIEFCTQIAQQKPVKPKDTITVLRLPHGQAPTPEQFMAGRIEWVDDDQIITDADVDAFVATFTRHTRPRALINRQQWLQRDGSSSLQRHANFLVHEAVRGWYSAEDAVTAILTGCRRHGADPDPIVKAAIGALLDAKVSA